MTRTWNISLRIYEWNSAVGSFGGEEGIRNKLNQHFYFPQSIFYLIISCSWILIFCSLSTTLTCISSSLILACTLAACRLYASSASAFAVFTCQNKRFSVLALQKYHYKLVIGKILLKECLLIINTQNSKKIHFVIFPEDQIMITL